MASWLAREAVRSETLLFSIVRYPQSGISRKKNTGNQQSSAPYIFRVLSKRWFVPADPPPPHSFDSESRDVSVQLRMNHHKSESLSEGEGEKKEKQQQQQKKELTLSFFTHLQSQQLLAGFNVPLDLTRHRLNDFNTVLVEHIEHVPDAQTWGRKAKTSSLRHIPRIARECAHREHLPRK